MRLWGGGELSRSMIRLRGGGLLCGGVLVSWVGVDNSLFFYIIFTNIIGGVGGVELGSSLFVYHILNSFKQFNMFYTNNLYFVLIIQKLHKY